MKKDRAAVVVAFHVGRIPEEVVGLKAKVAAVVVMLVVTQDDKYLKNWADKRLE